MFRLNKERTGYFFGDLGIDRISKGSESTTLGLRQMLEAVQALKVRTLARRHVPLLPGDDGYLCVRHCH
jgi:hypothetical protein